MKKAFLVTLILLFLCACGSSGETIETVLPDTAQDNTDLKNEEAPTTVVNPTKTVNPIPTPTKDVWGDSLTLLPVIEGGKDDLPGEYLYIPTNCGEQIRVLPPSAEYGVRFGWGTKEEIQMDEFLQAARIGLSIDGKPVNYDGRTASILNEESSMFVVWFYKIVGTFELGLHSIEQKIIFDDEYSDGFEIYGPGTENEVLIYKCEFMIQEVD